MYKLMYTVRVQGKYSPNGDALIELRTLDFKHLEDAMKAGLAIAKADSLTSWRVEEKKV